ncbi:hypothetical protein P22_1575 [Propionispora sp. 2/2-37]|uniref:flagellar basal-body rod protein FlgF n=1 Tax=Propionispora sp. 2/2-37 TaxID=1677858 RepID=UPI0006BB5F89|nr:flagellar basal-body rod protein FlgF [Propionispora sp. 2/2-37]CUH95504.1 hypothetical protein P22_1575 [Propionispora sp. 2/2-37]
MIRGIYTAASGMLAESLRTDTIANNLANVNTAGYKKDVAVSQDFRSMYIERINDGPETPIIGNIGVGALIEEIATIHTAGPMLHSGNHFDLAISGEGYFTVATPNGVRYTRNGSFTRNAQGILVTQEGYPVMGQNGGTIRVDGQKVVISGDGQVAVDGINVGALQVAAFDNENQLVKEGATLYIAPDGVQARAAGGLVSQGYLEQSNVNTVSEMVNMIAGYRAYEANSKAVQAQDQLLDKAVNEVGRVS